MTVAEQIIDGLTRYAESLENGNTTIVAVDAPLMVPMPAGWQQGYPQSLEAPPRRENVVFMYDGTPMPMDDKPNAEACLPTHIVQPTCTTCGSPSCGVAYDESGFPMAGVPCGS